MDKINDKFQYIKKLTLKKVFNIIQLLLSYSWSKYTKWIVMTGYPTSISIEPTTNCNLSCPQCPSGLKQFSRKTGKMDFNFYKKIIDENKSFLTNILFYFQGEPFLNSKLIDMISLANKNNIYTVTSTNAHFLDDKTAQKTVKSKLDKIIISLDGVTQEIYEQYRKKGSLNKVLQGIENIIKWKKKLKSKTPYVSLQFLVVKPNQHQIEDIVKLGQKLEVNNVKLKTAQIYNFENKTDLIPTIEKYSRYKKNKEGKYEIKNKLLNECFKMWHSCVVTWDGQVVPCCFDKDAKFKLGNIQIDTLKNIWKNNQYKNLRKKIFQGRKNIKICQNCIEGTKVWIE